MGSCLCISPWTGDDCEILGLPPKITRILDQDVTEGTLFEVRLTTSEVWIIRFFCDIATYLDLFISIGKHTYPPDRSSQVTVMIAIFTNFKDSQHYHRHIHHCLGSWCCQSIGILMASCA